MKQIDILKIANEDFVFSHICAFPYIYIYMFLKVNGQSIGLKKEVAYQVTETHQKALKIINNRAIHFVKEGNISKFARKNMCKPSLLEGCTCWLVATDLKHNFIFPTEIALTTKSPDIVIWR